MRSLWSSYRIYLKPGTSMTITTLTIAMKTFIQSFTNCRGAFGISSHLNYYMHGLAYQLLRCLPLLGDTRQPGYWIIICFIIYQLSTIGMVYCVVAGGELCMPGWSTGMFHSSIPYSSLDHRITILTIKKCLIFLEDISRALLN